MTEHAVSASGRPAAPTVAGLVAGLAATLGGGGRDRAEATALARDIVAALEGQPRSWPLLHGGASVARPLRDRAHRAALALARGAPFAYAVGRVDFRHLTLRVDERVLVPRPETEMLVDLVFDELGGAAAATGLAIDIGTGSGAIALALASEGRFSRVIATDISLDALAVARRNVELVQPALHAMVELRHGALLDPVRDLHARVIVSNPPYIAYDEAAALPPGVRDWEPPVALYSGRDGLAATAALVSGAGGALQADGLLAIEVDVRRASLVAEMVAREPAFRSVRVALDLTGRERFVLARRRESQ